MDSGPRSESRAAGPFGPVAVAADALGPFCRDLDLDAVLPADAVSAIEGLERVKRLAAAAQLELVRAVDGSVVGDQEGAKARWWAARSGQCAWAARRDITTAEALGGLTATDTAVRRGELTAEQAHEVTSAAVLDPSAEAELLDLARDGSLSELKRAAKKVRASATDEDEKGKDAHANRDLSSGVDEETGEGRFNGKGPTTSVAELLALLEPWVQAEFDKARRESRRERRGALGFDALMSALRFAAACRRGQVTRSGPSGPDGPASWPSPPDGPGSGPSTPDGPASWPSTPDGPVSWPSGPPVDILVRVDLPAIRRGHTLAGETCEVDGFGPVPVAALREWLPQAAIDLILTNGVDAFNVTHFGRQTLARQQVVLDLLGGQCTRLGCPATRHLQVDHRIDWARVHVTELRNLDWLCVADHHRKTHDGWALVPGRGRRRMVPPDDPDHPASAPPTETPVHELAAVAAS